MNIACVLCKHRVCLFYAEGERERETDRVRETDGREREIERAVKITRRELEKQKQPYSLSHTHTLSAIVCAFVCVCETRFFEEKRGVVCVNGVCVCVSALV